jgi:DNA-directed RNA polymerase specialized sigma24 family protein
MGLTGSGESFAAVVPTYATAKLRVATALIGPMEAEDAVQEAAMRAWQACAGAAESGRRAPMAAAQHRQRLP